MFPSFPPVFPGFFPHVSLVFNIFFQYSPHFPVFDSTKDCYISRWNNSPQPREICSGRVACLNFAGELLRIITSKNCWKQLHLPKTSWAPDRKWFKSLSQVKSPLVILTTSPSLCDPVQVLHASNVVTSSDPKTMAHSLVTAYNPRPWISGC